MEACSRAQGLFDGVLHHRKGQRFRDFDTNGDKAISLDEWTAVFKDCFGAEEREEKLQKLFDYFDANKDGKISKEEFHKGTTAAYEPEIARLVADEHTPLTEHKGAITRSTFVNALKELKCTPDPRECGSEETAREVTRRAKRENKGTSEMPAFCSKEHCNWEVPWNACKPDEDPCTKKVAKRLTKQLQQKNNLTAAACANHSVRSKGRCMFSPGVPTMILESVFLAGSKVMRASKRRQMA